MIKTIATLEENEILDQLIISGTDFPSENIPNDLAKTRLTNRNIEIHDTFIYDLTDPDFENSYYLYRANDDSRSKTNFEENHLLAQIKRKSL